MPSLSTSPSEPPAESADLVKLRAMARLAGRPLFVRFGQFPDGLHYRPGRMPPVAAYWVIDGTDDPISILSAWVWDLQFGLRQLDQLQLKAWRPLYQPWSFHREGMTIAEELAASIRKAFVPRLVTQLYSPSPVKALFGKR